MLAGMLWFDDGPEPLPAKVARAAAHYRAKYRERPTLCLVNPADLNGAPRAVEGVALEADPHVPRGHLLIGVAEA